MAKEKATTKKSSQAKNLMKQPTRVVLSKRCSENMQQIYRRTPMPKCDFNLFEIALRRGCSPVNLLHIIRTSFTKNTSGRLLLNCEILV